MHILSDANGLPLLVGVSAANVHDSEGLTGGRVEAGDGLKAAGRDAQGDHDVVETVPQTQRKHLRQCVLRFCPADLVTV